VGNYVEVPGNTGKAASIVAGKVMVMVNGDAGNPLEKFSRQAEWSYAPPYTAEIVTPPPAWADVPEDKALICVVSNGMFEAAGLAYSEAEYDEFRREDGRPRTWVLMDKQVAYQASGYKPRD
jgi:hypothetical protein